MVDAAADSGRLTDAQARPQQPISRLSVVSWWLYDLANTIFSQNIISLYFSLWVVNVMHGRDQDFGNATALSMGLIFITAPVLGAMSDQAPRRMPFLRASTLVCVGFTLFLGTGGLALSLLYFMLANYFYQASLIFYEALLPDVSTREDQGRVSGIGVGIGYVGSYVALAAGILILRADPTAYGWVFRATALLVLLFALPGFVFIRERVRAMPAFSLDAVPRAFSQTVNTVRHSRRYPGLTRFLFGRIFYSDAATTVVAFMGIYLTNELGFTPVQSQLVLLDGITSAIVGSFIFGFIVDRIGPRRSLNLVLRLWMVALGLAVAVPVLHLPSTSFWLIAALIGASLGGTWCSDRPYLLRLSPPRYVGEFFGLYAMSGRFSAMIGPLIWGFVVDTLHWGRPAAVFTLLVMTVISYVILQGVTDEPREWGAEDLVETT